MTDPATTTPASSSAASPARKRSGRPRKPPAPPPLVEVRRGDIVESVHRGSIVVVGEDGKVAWSLGSTSQVVTLRSTVKPFALVALLESGAADELELTDDELAIMAGSHAGEDKHVRTVQAMFRRASVSQTVLLCGTRDAPSDPGTRARLARDGETPGPVRHACSGFHAASILLSRYSDWSLDDYTDPAHPSQQAVRETVARLFGQQPEKLVTAVDNCGLTTYAMPLVEVARAYRMLADPASIPADDPRARSAGTLERIRDAMMARPEMVGSSLESLDTELMRQRRGGIVSKVGTEGLRGVGLVRGIGRGPAPAGVALTIEDGDGAHRASRAVTIEALAQIGTLDERDLRALAGAHRPITLGPQDEEIAVTVPRFELAAAKGSTT